jgi:hypothetical protein
VELRISQCQVLSEQANQLDVSSELHASRSYMSRERERERWSPVVDNSVDLNMSEEDNHF